MSFKAYLLMVVKTRECVVKGKHSTQPDLTTQKSKLLLTLSQMANFRLFQNERVYTTISNLMKMEESSSSRLKNTVGKGEIAQYEQFLLFP